MKIFVDADASPIIDLVSEISREFQLPLVFVKNYSQNIRPSYGQVVTVDISDDSADFYIFSQLSPGDLLISQDYGLISLALSKGCICMDNKGQIIDNQSIDFILNNRHISSKLRREQKLYSKIKKREAADDELFEKNLRNILDRV